MARIATGTSVIRAVEAVLAVWILKDALKLSLDGKADAGISNAILAILLVIIVEGLLWLVPRVVQWAEEKWKISSDEVLGRIVQTVILAFMAVDAADFLITGNGIGVNQGGCLLSLLILEAIIRGVIRPDPRPAQMAQALRQAQARVRVFTQLPSAKVRETLGLVRGISDIEAGSALEFELAEQEALYLMLKQALSLGANAVIDTRLTTATYETSGSGWQVARPVYTGTAVRV